MDKLTGPQIGQLRDLLVEAFSREDFRQLLRIKLEIQFDAEYNASGLPFKDALFEFIQDMERKGRTASLIQAVREARADNADFNDRLEAILANTNAPTSAPILKTAIPNNLPSLQPFFGREKELADIRTALDPESRTWGTLIDGDGGMGKTSLAVRAAYDAPATHFKKIIFVSVKQREMDDHKERSLDGFAHSSWLEMLNVIARELDQSEITKSLENERAKLVKEALRGQRVLLILDNLETLSEPEQDQLFTFLEYLPSDCKALLTSRIFSGNKLQAVKLHELDQASALMLFDEIAKHNRAFAKSTEAERINLHKETSGRPLLMRWVAGQVGSGHCTCLADALAHLRSCPEGNDPLNFIFGDVLTTLSGADIKILAALSFPSQPIPIKAISEISGVATDYVRRHLKVLTNIALAVPYQDEKEYSLVPMVGDFLRKARHEVMKQTGDRLEKRAYALIIENGYKKHDRFPFLEAAWPGITPALTLFLAGENQRLQTVCDALSDFLHFQGRWDEQFALGEKAEARALAAADHNKAGWRAYDVGYIHYVRQQADAVLTCADRAAAHWAVAKAGARERAIAISLRGLGHQLKKDAPAAITDHREALELLRSRSAESADVAIGLNSLANAERESGNHDAAERNYRVALRMARTAGDPESVAAHISNLAQLALDRKDWTTAEALAREALPLSKAVHRQDLIANDNLHLAKALVPQDKTAEALPHARRAVDIFTRLGSPDLAGAQAILTECEAAVQ